MPPKEVSGEFNIQGMLYARFLTRHRLILPEACFIDIKNGAQQVWVGPRLAVIMPHLLLQTFPDHQVPQMCTVGHLAMTSHCI